MPFTKIVVAGSTGTLADDFLRAALRSTAPKFDVTVLTRHGCRTHPALPGATLIPVDYADHKSLTDAVRGHDAIVSLVGGLAAPHIDLQLLDAAQAAGVRRVFKSEYTVDILHPNMVSMYSHADWPPERANALTCAQEFLDRAQQDSGTSYTALMSSAFIDRWLQGNYGTFDPRGRKVTLIDGGRAHFTGCTLPFLADCIVAALQMDEDRTKNRRIPVAEIRTTMREVTETYEKVTGATFEVTHTRSHDLMARRDAALQRSDFATATVLSHMTGAFNGQGAGDLAAGMQFDADGFLTRKRKTLEEVCAEAMERVDAA